MASGVELSCFREKKKSKRPTNGSMFSRLVALKHMRVLSECREFLFKISPESGLPMAYQMDCSDSSRLRWWYVGWGHYQWVF